MTWRHRHALPRGIGMHGFLLGRIINYMGAANRRHAPSQNFIHHARSSTVGEMNIKTTPERPTPLRLAIGAATTLIALTVLCGTALAGTPAADPLATAGGSAASAFDVLTTYGPVIGGTYLLFAIAQALLARYGSSSWFAQGRRLAVATGTLGVIGAALQAQIAGSPWTVILAAAVAMAFKLLTPTVTPPTTTTTTSPTATAKSAATVSLSLLVLVALTLGASQVACGPKTTALVAGIWDCLAPERAEAVDALTPFAESVILAAASADGKLIDTTKIRAATSKANLNTATGVLLECAMASAVTALLSQPGTPTPSAAQTSGAVGLVLSPEALRDMWAQVAPPNVSFRTAHGVL